jgi:hypothetical protein
MLAISCPIFEFWKQKTRRLRNPAPNHHAIDDQQQDCSNNRTNETCGLALLVLADRPAEKTRDQCSYDANEHRDNNPARIFAGHDELRDGPDDEADDEHPQEVQMCLVGYCVLIGIATQIAQVPSSEGSGKNAE